MSFYELETWQPRPGVQAEHDALIRRWFGYVREHHAALFCEWASARYFREVERNADAATGRNAMLFGYRDHAAFAGYKERRKDYAGPHQDYLKIDPFIYFDMDTKTQAFWQPSELSLWLTE